MGKMDSTRTRVTPVFDQLRQKHQDSSDWILELIRLFESGKPEEKRHLTGVSAIAACSYGLKEARLLPPRKLLEWLLENLEESTVESTLLRKKKLKEPTPSNRRALAKKDALILAEARRLLAASSLKEASWFILEGKSQPDLFVDTPEFLLVLEGKRTETGPTRHTDYLANRLQMLRHMDAAWEIRAGRPVFGGFVVEGRGVEPCEVPPVWLEAAKQTVSPHALALSLPHRSPEERSEMATGFLGVVTWQKLCRELGLDYTLLPHTV